MRVSSAARLASYRIASCSAKDRLDTPPAKQQSMCESVCSLISSMSLHGGFCTLVLSFIVVEVATCSYIPFSQCDVGVCLHSKTHSLFMFSCCTAMAYTHVAI